MPLSVRRGHCNRCQLDDLLRVAHQADAHLEIRPRGAFLPAGLEKQEQYSGPLGSGYDLFIVYADGPAWASWIAGLEPQCWCGGQEGARV